MLTHFPVGENWADRLVAFLCTWARNPTRKGSYFPMGREIQSEKLSKQLVNAILRNEIKSKIVGILKRTRDKIVKSSCQSRKVLSHVLYTLHSAVCQSYFSKTENNKVK